MFDQYRATRTVAAMIKIDQDKCNSCGLCVKVCHEYCLQLEDDQLKVDYTYCSTCTQCVAICPQQAITWEGNIPVKFDPSHYPAPEQVRELFMQRRTIRDYTSQPVERSILEEISVFAAYAPTHNFDFRIIILDDTKFIDQIDSLIYKSVQRIYRWMYQPGIILAILKRTVPAWEFEFLKAKPKLEHAIKRGNGMKSKPPAMMLIVGDKRIPLSLESAQYALYNIDLYAQSKGIACRNLVGNQGVINRSKSFRKAIGLKKHEKIFGTITMGYPAVKFRNKVTGRRLPVQWNSA